MANELHTRQWGPFLLLAPGSPRVPYPLIGSGFSPIPEGPAANVITRTYAGSEQVPTAGLPKMFRLAAPESHGWRRQEVSVVTELSGRVVMAAELDQGKDEDAGGSRAELVLAARLDFPNPVPLQPGGSPVDGWTAWLTFDSFPAPAVGFLQDNSATVLWATEEVLYSLTLRQPESISDATLALLASQLEAVRGM